MAVDCDWLAEDACIGIHAQPWAFWHTNQAVFNFDWILAVIVIFEIWLSDPGTFEVTWLDETDFK